MAGYGAYETDKQVNGESMNTEMAPFDNVEVRRAVAAAIDREHYRMVKPASLRVANGPVPPEVEGYDPGARGQTHDDSAALAHMAKAGYPFDPATGRGGYPNVIAYPVYKQGLPEFTAQVLQQALAKRSDSHRAPRALVPDVPGAHPPARAIRDRPGDVDRGLPRRERLSRAALRLEGHQRGGLVREHGTFYKNSRVDALLEEARRELDPGRRRSLFGEASSIVCDDAPWAFTYSYRWYAAWQPYVRGYKPHAVWTNYVRDAWIDRDAAHDPSRALGALVPRPAWAVRAMRRVPRSARWRPLVSRHRLGVFVVDRDTRDFVVNNVLPADPARMALGPQARPADVARVRTQLGLDQPLLVQYGRFVGRLVHVGDRARTPITPRAPSSGPSTSISAGATSSGAPSSTSSRKSSRRRSCSPPPPSPCRSCSASRSASSPP